jgi:hypothetical protein
MMVMLYDGIVTPFAKKVCPQMWTNWRDFFKLPEKKLKPYKAPEPEMPEYVQDF